MLDFFAHSGTTLLAAEISGRRCFTVDNDPIFAEISIRRLERFRKTGCLGWQNGHPFEQEIPSFAVATDDTLNTSQRPTPQKVLF